jgi:hypothetical protein
MAVLAVEIIAKQVEYRTATDNQGYLERVTSQSKVI